MKETSYFASMESRRYCSNRGYWGPSVIYCCFEEGGFCPEAPQVMSNCEILQFDNQHI